MTALDLSASPLIVLIPQEGESWDACLHRIDAATERVLLLIAGRENEWMDQPVLCERMVQECAQRRATLTVATRQSTLVRLLRASDVTVVDSVRALRTLLEDHPGLPDALRVFSPHLWRQQLTSRLQRIGLLSMPRLRIFALVAFSALLFFVVVFRLLPSAEITVHPRQEPVTQTMNIFLVSGTGVDLGSARVRTLPLLPIVVSLDRTLTFSHISKEFTGTPAVVMLTVLNASPETYSLRSGTRFTNQAGMTFRSEASVIVEPGQEAVVRAIADPTDLYGQIIGERGNVPAGLTWQLPGLSEPERVLVTAENRSPATGGTTSYITVLKEDDIETARLRLQQELLTAAREATEARLARLERDHPGSSMTLLRYDQLTAISYGDVHVPMHQIGMQTDNITLSGSILFRMFAYDAAQVFPMLVHELRAHVREGRRLVESNVHVEHLVAHVIDYAADQSWIKLTVDLAASEEYVLDPLLPQGALFARNVRSLVTGKELSEALRIIRNLPEVETASISQWPPWQRTLPEIASHISIIPR